MQAHRLICFFAVAAPHGVHAIRQALRPLFIISRIIGLVIQDRVRLPFSKKALEPFVFVAGAMVGNDSLQVFDDLIVQQDMAVFILSPT